MRNPKALLLIKLYEVAESRIAAIIRGVLTEGVRGLAEVRRRRLEISLEIRRVRNETPELARDSVTASFDRGLNDADKAIGTRRGRPLSSVLTRSAGLLTENLTASLNRATTLIGRRAEDVLRREGLRGALREIEQATPEGFSADETVRRLQREGVTGFVDKAGRRWKLSTYAEMAVRTTVAEANAQGMAQKMAERGFDLVEVSSHTCSHHPDDPESPCVRLEGGTFSLSGESDEHEHLAELPPWHPRCGHGIFPSPKNFEITPELEAVA